ncbi:MAG: hypothetical protein IJM14_02665 [Lachnospiraceae bacterium]|jgi:hypothetical protein|nr:hypothetical protein [Lachnospiraceae bacterium]
MFWNKNDDINKDWKDYEKYKREKEARDREYYQNDYPQYRYNENEHHVHDDHCDIGVRTPGQVSKDQLKKIRAAIIFCVIVVIMISFAFRVVDFKKWLDSSKKKDQDVVAYYLSELEAFYISDVKNVKDHMEVQVRKVSESDLETVKVEFAFFDKENHVLEENIASINTYRMKVGSSKTAVSIKFPSDAVSAIVTLKK